MTETTAGEGASPMMRLRHFCSRRHAVAQVLFVAILVAIVYAITETAKSNLDRLSLQFGYDFLWEKAAFELGESPISYNAGDTYFRAFVVGLLNTLKVAFFGIILSTVVGVVIALGQLSPSAVVARVCRAYVDIVRNVPLLMQLVFWHTFLSRALPTVRQALSPVDGVYLTNRGLYLPAPQADPVHGSMAIALLVGLLAAVVLYAWSRGRGRRGRVKLWIPAVLLAPPICIFLLAGAPLVIEYPELRGFNFSGGMEISPEFAAMLLGLTLYIGAFNAEIIRAGILGVPRGQLEAGSSLGLKRHRVMRLIVLPQALKIIIPPISNSYLNLTKESSLAVAIGYPEVVRVANITLAETSRSIECISIIMLVYLTLSLSLSALLNWFNARVARDRK